jgi:hypothetical protein
MFGKLVALKFIVDEDELVRDYAKNGLHLKQLSVLPRTYLFQFFDGTADADLFNPGSNTGIKLTLTPGRIYIDMLHVNEQRRRQQLSYVLLEPLVKSGVPLVVDSKNDRYWYYLLTRYEINLRVNWHSSHYAIKYAEFLAKIQTP